MDLCHCMQTAILSSLCSLPQAYEEGLFGQLSMDVGNLYTNIGLVYRRMRNLDKAEEAYLK